MNEKKLSNFYTATNMITLQQTFDPMYVHRNTDSYRNPSTQGNERMIQKKMSENERNEEKKKCLKHKSREDIADWGWLQHTLMIIALRTVKCEITISGYTPNGVHKPRVLNDYRRLNYGANAIQKYNLLVSKQTIPLRQRQKQRKITYKMRK